MWKFDPHIQDLKLLNSWKLKMLHESWVKTRNTSERKLLRNIRKFLIACKNKLREKKRKECGISQEIAKNFFSPEKESEIARVQAKK